MPLYVHPEYEHLFAEAKRENAERRRALLRAVWALVGYGDVDGLRYCLEEGDRLLLEAQRGQGST